APAPEAAEEVAPAPEAAEEAAPAPAAAKKEAPGPKAVEKAAPAPVNPEKGKIKVQIRELKSQRDAALQTHDHKQLKAIRRRIRTLKRKSRALTA
ncbi:MAG: hypothetical protein O6826_02370, partial [Acidobacteria bacterium]|nr:hypothetical protein [Acidobacteriota bacterium]